MSHTFPGTGHVALSADIAYSVSIHSTESIASLRLSQGWTGFSRHIEPICLTDCLFWQAVPKAVHATRFLKAAEDCSRMK